MLVASSTDTQTWPWVCGLAEDLRIFTCNRQHVVHYTASCSGYTGNLSLLLRRSHLRHGPLAGRHEGDELVQRGDICSGACHNHILICSAARECPLCGSALPSSTSLFNDLLHLFSTSGAHAAKHPLRVSPASALHTAGDGHTPCSVTGVPKEGQTRLPAHAVGSKAV